MCKLCRKYHVKPQYEWLLHEDDWDVDIADDDVIVSPATARAATPYAPPKNTDEAALIKRAIQSGTRSENALTDLVFFKRHPERNGRLLSPSEPAFSTLSTEWRLIRDALVRPALQPPAVPGPPPVVPSEPAHGTLTLDVLLNTLQQNGYVIYQRPYELNIVGVRAATAQPNHFDDTINFFYKDNNNAWQFRSCPATTDPGTYYLNNPINPGSGTAILKPGQYIGMYQIGLHRNIYEALVQRGNLTVIRDPNRDNVLDFGGQEYTGSGFGINIHRAKTSGTAQQVDNFSAGCQVFATTSDFDFFMTLCKEHQKRYGNRFTYTLLDEDELYEASESFSKAHVASREW